MKFNSKHILLNLSVLTAISISTVLILYVTSENVVHRHNTFIRQYPHHPIQQTKFLDLGYNSYYLAAITGDTIYLGNKTAPLRVITAPLTLSDTSHININLSENINDRYHFIQLRINKPNFYLLDGSIPMILKGNLKDWIAQSVPIEKSINFSLEEAMTTDKFIVRSRALSNNEDCLCSLSLINSEKLICNPDLLIKQNEGVFSTDGMLLYSSFLKRLVYVYYYRNEFIVATKNLKLDYRGKTIDTISKAILEVTELESDHSRKLSSAPLLVNKRSAVDGHYLFVNSGILGRFEPEEMLKEAAIIDVYDITKNTYEFSFYLPNYKDEPVREFQISHNVLIALSGRYLIAYKLDTNYFKIPTI
tara:strand:+ start:131 stop:1216 length:1086 start_codon:yes stop_codon:yes gene_type:complete